MKKLVKCLLASGLLVGMLAACSPQKDCSCDPTSDQPASSEAPSSSSSSSETPVPPEPQPEPKTEWTRAEELVFAQYEIAELPFASELSIEDATDGVVLATSKEEVTTDDVDAYVTLLEEQVTKEGDNVYIAINDFLALGFTQDLEMLGFDLAASDVYQYLREFDPEYNSAGYQNLVSVGINEDGLLQVASATVCLPYFTMWDGTIGGGMEPYPLLYETSSGREVDLLSLLVAPAYSAMINESMAVAANAMPFDETIVHPEIVKEYTAAVIEYPGLYAPYYLSNVYSSYYDQTGLNLYYINYNEDFSGLVTYTQADFDTLIENVKASESLLDFDEEKKVATYSFNGSLIEVTYALTDYNADGSIKCIELDYVVKSYEMPNDEFGVIGVVATGMGNDPEFSFKDDTYYSDAAFFDMSLEEVLSAFDGTLLDSGLVSVTEEWTHQTSGQDLYYVQYEFIVDGDKTAVELTALAVDLTSSKGYVLVELQGYHITAAEYAAYLFNNYVMNSDDSKGSPYGYAYSIYAYFGQTIFQKYVQNYVVFVQELLTSEGITFTTAEQAIDTLFGLLDDTFKNAFENYAAEDLEQFAGMVQADYETADWNKLQAAATSLQTALDGVHNDGDDYRLVAYYLLVLENLFSTVQTWREKYQAQLEEAKKAAYGYDKESGEYKYDDADFNADALADANAAVQAFTDVVNTEGATATEGKAKLYAAIAKLQALTPDKATLTARLTAAYGEYVESDYSPENWTTLTGIYNTALELIGKEETSFDDGKAAYLQALTDMAAVEKL